MTSLPVSWQTIRAALAGTHPSPLPDVDGALAETDFEFDRLGIGESQSGTTGYADAAKRVFITSFWLRRFQSCLTHFEAVS
jgi:hypothetical protein